MGVNIGGLFGPLLTGWLQESQGFHWGFGAAAVGMALGLASTPRGRKNLPAQSHPSPTRCRPRSATYGLIFAGIAAAVAVLLVTGAVNAENLAMTMA